MNPIIVSYAYNEFDQRSRAAPRMRDLYEFHRSYFERLRAAALDERIDAADC